MATLGELLPSTSSVSSLPNLTACFDPNDIDAYINYDQPIYPSPSLSPASSRSKTAASHQPTVQSSSSNLTSASTPSGTSVASNNGSIASNQSSQLLFSAPSHEYDSYKQQTGLPMGSLANTIDINQVPGMNFGLPNQPYMMPADGYYGMGRQNEGVDFSSTPVRNFSSRESSDMDLEVDTPTDGFQPFLFSSPPPARNQFVDPNTLGAPEIPLAGSSNPVGRVYPGMHQRAAMAKAAQQQKQQELLRRQQQQQRRVDVESNRQGAKPHSKARSNDPVVEERISRLLQQMRQTSVVAHEEDNMLTNPLPNIAKSRKDEEDMDEDERLLASEEGKKLSSKERRQLRNKVSARAFRSRRKEYISQLEGEVAAKATEANDLRMQNRALMEENARLTDLTRMLLSSSHFSSFLNDLSASGLPGAPANLPSAAQTPFHSKSQKDANQAGITPGIHMQHDHQANMAVVPEQSFDYPAMEMNGPGWNSGIDMNFNNTPVYAVLDVPQGPAVDSANLSGKSSNLVGPLPPEDPKDQVPIIEHPPIAERPPIEQVEADKNTPAACPSVEIDESDPSLALFVDQPACRTTTVKPFEDLFGGVEPEKVFARFDLVVEGTPLSEPDDVGVATMSRFERLCTSMEPAFQRISLLTSRL